MKEILLCSLLTIFGLNTYAQNWVQLGNDMNGQTMGDYFGTTSALSADGHTIAIGAPNNSTGGNKAGQVQVYTYNGSSWSQKGTDINGEAGMERTSGVDISADGNIVAIAALDNNGYSKKVRVFKFDGTDWVQRGNNLTSATGSLSEGGVGISADGKRVVFGNAGFDGSTGQVKAYAWTDTSWVQLGSDIIGTEAGGKFGTTLSFSADGVTFITGSRSASPQGQASGEVSIYEFDGTDWVRKGAAISGEQTYAGLGSDVDISADGSVIIIGEYGFSSGEDKGRTRVFSWSGTQWTQKGADIEGLYYLDKTGLDVAINNAGDIIATKGLGYGASEQGNVRMFSYDGVGWNQIGQTMEGQGSDAIGSGLDFDASGKIISVGNPRWTTNTGQLKVYSFDSTTNIKETIFFGSSIYPNPSNGHFIFDLGNEYNELTVQVSNMLGQIISTQNYTSAKKIELEISNVAGIYFVNLSTVKGKSQTFKIIKQ